MRDAPSVLGNLAGTHHWGSLCEGMPPLKDSDPSSVTVNSAWHLLPICEAQTLSIKYHLKNFNFSACATVRVMACVCEGLRSSASRERAGVSESKLLLQRCLQC